MDLGFLSFLLCAGVIAPLPYGDPTTSCDCLQIPPMNRTNPPPSRCSAIGGTFRYTCVVGYLRQAGTSNLIKCVRQDGVAKWSAPTLQCIPNASVPPAQPATPKPAPTAPGDDHGSTTAGEKGGGSPTSTSQPVQPNQTTENQWHGNRQRDGGQSPADHVSVTIPVVISILVAGALIGLAILCYKRRAGRGQPQAAGAEDADVGVKLNQQQLKGLEECSGRASQYL
ncbi:interleukin-15 receptor subunit alpha isoform X2 [Nelusetta ayraudi]|uniref:interleukin-15 receptor subunit alpha isoform X2 n=1 Tax=Nelusetta ayraudi TaxID=303726 RepID=UPI003F6F2228